MDALQRLKKRNEEHKALIEAENKSILPFFLHAVFVTVLLYYEVFSKVEQDFTLENFKILVFIYLIYNFVLLDFCHTMASHYAVRSLLVAFFHCAFIYYWVVWKDVYGVAYFTGVLACLSVLKFFYKKVIRKGAVES